MEDVIIDTVIAFRRQLHELAERSGEERRTKACLMAFLQKYTTLRLDDHGTWFCAVHEERDATETLAFRADMDALPCEAGAEHLCGHDGHSAVLAGLGLYIENKMLGKNIVLIFQHAEETGAGGQVCSRALPQYKVDRVYAFHNIPGWKEGTILLRDGTFACASRGMTVAFTGATSHAAYPEFGRNPGFAAARLITKLPELTDPSRFSGLAMATLIGAEIGEKTFGTAAGTAEVHLTLRAWADADLDALTASIEETALLEGERDGVDTSIDFCDIFPATLNSTDMLMHLRKLCRSQGLVSTEIPVPFRWSEDFGYYGSLARSVMVGIGAGEDWPQLHTAQYEFNDRIVPDALKLFSLLAQFG